MRLMMFFLLVGVANVVFVQHIRAQQGLAQQEDALKVFVCGSSSPLHDLRRAKACIAVQAGEDLFLFDTGSGSGARLAFSGLPMHKLRGVLFTHFHSDHISDVYNINLTSWASGRKYSLPVYGPVGIDRVIAGMNEAYALDRSYRVAHHGEKILQPEHGLLVAKTVPAGPLYENGVFSITAVAVDHSPIEPAFGYRIDYADRSVVISGDSVVSDALMAVSQGVDLLLHDALSLALLDGAIQRSERAGMPVRAQILRDVTNYHAHAGAIVAAAREAKVKQLAFYHLVPPPQNEQAAAIFMRGIEADAILTEDMMWFELPVDSEALLIKRPGE